MDENVEKRGEIDLNTLNPKQLQKEYKATQKEIKSKDLAVKQIALDKFKERRYLTDGGCFIPLINSIPPKKKTLDYTKTALDFLVKFFSESGNEENESATVKALSSVYKQENNLEILKLLTDSLLFKEEVKKPKTKKKKSDEPIEEPKENPTVVDIRFLTLKCCYYITHAFYGKTEYTELREAIAKIPNFYQNMFETLLSFFTNFDLVKEKPMDDPDRVTALQELLYALSTILMITRNSKEASLSLLEHQALKSLYFLYVEPLLTLQCAQIFEVLSRYSEGVLFFSDIEPQSILREMVTGGLKNLIDVEAEAAVAATGGKKEQKKVEKPKKGAAPVPEPVNPMETLDYIRVPPPRLHLTVIKCVLKVFTRVGLEQGSLLEIESAVELGPCVAQLLLNKTVHRTMREPMTFPLDESLDDLVHVMCVALSTFGDVSADIRQKTCFSGSLTSLLSVLVMSRSVITGEAPPDLGDGESVTPVKGKGKGKDAVVETEVVKELDEKGQQSLENLRRVAEKAVLSLITQKIEKSEEEEEGEDLHEGSKPARWSSANGFLLDEDAFAEDHLMVSRLLTMLGMQEKDKDLANRGLRFLAVALQGCKEPLELVTKFELHSNFIEKLSTLTKKQSVKVVQDSVLASVKESQDLITTELAALELQDDLLGEEMEGKEAGEITEELNEEVPPKPVDILIPSPMQTLYHSLSVLEVFLQMNPETVNVFATKDRIEALADLLRVTGHVNFSNTVQETKVQLIDPRVLSFFPAAGDPEHLESQFLRPLIFDVITLLVKTDKKYRTYEADVPPPPCEEFPASQCPCTNAALLACKLTADPCIATLLSQSKLQTSESTLIVLPSEGFQLELLVQDAALRLMESIAELGVLGVDAAVEAVGEAGFGTILGNLDPESLLSQKNSLQVLRTTIEDLKNGESTELVPVGFSWKRPQFFEDMFPWMTVESGDRSFPTSVPNLPGAPSVWPLVTYCISLQTILANPKANRNSVSIAFSAIKQTLRVPQLLDHSQPVITDCVSATFLGLGGGVTLAGLFGRFGNVEDSLAGDGLAFMQFLFSRGMCRSEFWEEWMEAHKEVVEIDPKTGKPKKTDKKKQEKEKKKDTKKGAVEETSVVPPIVYNIESTEETPDPNKGPNAEFWTKLLDTKSDDLHAVTTSIPPLISLIQSSLSDLALLLIDQGVELNESDDLGVTALMYALLMGDEAVTMALVGARCEVNNLDCYGNPAIKYALMSLSPEDISKHLSSHFNIDSDDQESPKVFGSPTLLSHLFGSTVDFNVRDPGGNSPILVGLGLGELISRIGGFTIYVTNESFNDERCAFETIYRVTEQLIQAGTEVNACNLSGLVPLHVASARGHTEVIQLLFQHGAIPNYLDKRYFLPLHYVAACCPKNAVKSFDILMRESQNMSLHTSEYEDFRTGKTMEEKESKEFTLFLENMLLETLCPNVVQQRRLTFSEIMVLTAEDQLNFLHLCFSSMVIFKTDPLLGPFIANDKYERMTLALHLVDLATKCIKPVDSQLLTDCDRFGMSVLHAASLCFQGVTPQVELTPKQKTSRRIRYYASDEAHLLELIFDAIITNGKPHINQPCTREVYEMAGWRDGTARVVWTPMHGALLWSNPFLVDFLLEKGFDVSVVKLIHFLSYQSNPVDERILTKIFELYKALPNFKDFVNNCDEGGNFCQPIHAALRAKNLPMLKVLFNLPQVDVNAIDEDTGYTAIYEACRIESMEIFELFQLCQERLDLLIPCKVNSESEAEGETCVGAVIRDRNTDILMKLIHLRKNDVIEEVLAEKDYKPSTLIQLEQENLYLAKLLGHEPLSELNENGEVEPEMSEEAKSGDINTENMDAIEEGEENEEGIEKETKVEEVVKLTPEEEADIEDKLKRSNAVLKILIDLVNGTGMITEAHHIERTFFEGNLIFEP